MNPFDFVTAINTSKKNLIAEDPSNEKEYNPYLVNRSLSYFADTIMAANKMNVYNGLDKRLQFEYLINTIRSAKRFSKWAKKVENDDVEAIKIYYGYNDRHAKAVLSLLSSDQIKLLKEKLQTGGKP